MASEYLIKSSRTQNNLKNSTFYKKIQRDNSTSLFSQYFLIKLPSSTKNTRKSDRLSKSIFYHSIHFYFLNFYHSLHLCFLHFCSLLYYPQLFEDVYVVSFHFLQILSNLILIKVSKQNEMNVFDDLISHYYYY